MFLYKFSFIYNTYEISLLIWKPDFENIIFHFFLVLFW